MISKSRLPQLIISVLQLFFNTFTTVINVFSSREVLSVKSLDEQILGKHQTAGKQG